LQQAVKSVNYAPYGANPTAKKVTQQPKQVKETQDRNQQPIQVVNSYLTRHQRLQAAQGQTSQAPGPIAL
jgi:hypothetical protein